MTPPMMRVLTTPYVRNAMDPETLAYIEQERLGREGCILSLSWSSNEYRARLYDPELGDFMGSGRTVTGAVVDVIRQVQA